MLLNDTRIQKTLTFTKSISANSRGWETDVYIISNVADFTEIYVIINGKTYNYINRGKYAHYIIFTYKYPTSISVKGVG